MLANFLSRIYCRRRRRRIPALYRRIKSDDISAAGNQLVELSELHRTLYNSLPSGLRLRASMEYITWSVMIIAVYCMVCRREARGVGWWRHGDDRTATRRATPSGRI